MPALGRRGAPWGMANHLTTASHSNSAVNLRSRSCAPSLCQSVRTAGRWTGSLGWWTDYRTWTFLSPNLKHTQPFLLPGALIHRAAKARVKNSDSRAGLCQSCFCYPLAADVPQRLISLCLISIIDWRSRVICFEDNAFRSRLIQACKILRRMSSLVRTPVLTTVILCGWEGLQI